MTIPHTFADKTISVSLEDLDNNFSYLDGFETNTSNTFSKIIVDGQSNVVAESSSDNLTLEAGAGILLTTNANTDTITITNAGIATNSFSTVSVSGGGSVVANSTSNVLILASGTGISLSADPASNTITILNTGTGQVPTTNATSLNVSGNIAVSTTTRINSNGSIFTLNVIATNVTSTNVTATRNITTGNITCSSGASFRHLYANGNVISTENASFQTISTKNVKTSSATLFPTPKITTYEAGLIQLANINNSFVFSGWLDNDSGPGLIPSIQVYLQNSNVVITSSETTVFGPSFMTPQALANTLYEITWHLYGKKTTTSNSTFRVFPDSGSGSVNITSHFCQTALTGFVGASETGSGVGTPVGASIAYFHNGGLFEPTGEITLPVTEGMFYLNFNTTILTSSPPWNSWQPYIRLTAKCAAGTIEIRRGSYLKMTKLPRSQIGTFWTY